MAQRNGQAEGRAAQAPGARVIAVQSSELVLLHPECRLQMVPAPARLSRLTSDWIAETGLQTVVFALFATRPDAWTVGAQLVRVGFRGRVFALAPALPDRRMVERELRAEFKGLRLRVLPLLRARP